MAKRKLSKRLEKQAAAYQKLNLRKLDVSEWDDEVHRCIVANQVLQISDSQNALINDASIKAAFDAFALNTANPRHWKTLLHIFASEHFRTAPTTSKIGAPVKWTMPRLARLTNHVEQLEDYCSKMGHTWPGDTFAAEMIHDGFAGWYQGKNRVSVKQLARRIAEIRKKRAI
jgi:hypothetical protein